MVTAAVVVPPGPAGSAALAVTAVPAKKVLQLVQT
jgi:hypothetical protein